MMNARSANAVNRRCLTIIAAVAVLGAGLLFVRHRFFGGGAMLDDYGCVFHGMNSRRAMNALADFQKYLTTNGPTSSPSQGVSGAVWCEGKNTYYMLGDVFVMRYELLCHSPDPPKHGTQTQYGYAVWCKKIAPDFYWMLVNN